MFSGCQMLEIIVPISLDLDWPTKESVVRDIMEQYEEYGFTKFALACPGGGWRSENYPPTETFRRLSELFVQIKQDLASHGIVCGWWVTTTVKSGPSNDFVRMVKADGSLTPFASCPLDPNFRTRFSEDVALFAEIAKPAFIFTEDDYAIQAATGIEGCFCKYHLEEFSKRQKHVYSREELVQALREKNKDSYRLLRQWRELMKDSMIQLSVAMRRAVDRSSPEIPIGYMQPGCTYSEGDGTYEIARAMAGPKHTPFSRIFGTFYGGTDAKKIPEVLFNPLYSRQHIQGDFKYLHESDTFPHTRFFTSAAFMRAMMASVYSYGYQGSIFQTQQLLDAANEETVYGKMFAEERKRFNALYQLVQKCTLKGVQLCYDPFWNTVDDRYPPRGYPLWIQCVSRFGVAYGTLEAEVVFWDVIQATYADDTAVMQALSKGLFLDGDAAKALCERGYGDYIGVTVADDVTENGMLRYDLGAREVLRREYVKSGNGFNMPSAHMFSPKGNGKLLRMTVTNPNCEILSDLYTFQRKHVAPAMTRFENELGGRVVVMGMTLYGNNSQSLFNYRRQRLFQELIVWCADCFVFVKDTPDVLTIVNEINEQHNDEFKGVITLINLCEDDARNVSLHLPLTWRDATKFSYIDIDGITRALDYEKTDDGITIQQTIRYLEPIYIVVETKGSGYVEGDKK